METRFKSLKRTGVAYELLNWENRMDNYKYPGISQSTNATMMAWCDTPAGAWYVLIICWIAWRRLLFS